MNESEVTPQFHDNDPYRDFEGQREALAEQRQRWEKVSALAAELRTAADAYIDLAVCDLPGAGANASDRSDNFREVEYLLLKTLASIRFKNADQSWRDQVLRDWLDAWLPITERIMKEVYAQLEKQFNRGPRLVATNSATEQTQAAILTAEQKEQAASRAESAARALQSRFHYGPKIPG